MISLGTAKGLQTMYVSIYVISGLKNKHVKIMLEFISVAKPPFYSIDQV